MSARLPSIIIRHSDPSSQEELSTIMVDALPVPKARISDLKQARNKDLLVTFNSDQDKSLFREEIRELHQIKEKIVLTEPTKRNPSAIIFNIPKSFTETSIQKGLRQIFPQDLKVKFIFKGRDPDVQNWVFEVPAQHFHLLKDSQRVPINWTPFKISQFIHYKRCNNCQSFGHLSRDCFFSTPNCAYCGGHHEASLCNAERPSCINCYHHNIRFGTLMQLNHSSRDRSCPCLQTVKENYLKSIDYN
ncbi:hypothetical protein AVEN_237360-1 [Araneus ventricosus]|uniref:CCHC-type domain-containing protein n=1 Tax=Araneus ventricosus TaxID=182803 RepID=A0A4Y2UKL8_ARAVE|nr:hypothetical protein AVEN_237360-1 [Araneus ventricosus]